MKIKVIRDNRGEPRDERDKKISLDGINAKIALIGKLYEEVGEVANNQTDVYEYADVLEVLVELAVRNNINAKQIEEARKQKWLKLGGFEKCIVLITTNHDND